MIESIAKVMYLLLSGAFIFGAWSATLEFRVRGHEVRHEREETKVDNIEGVYRQDQKELINILGRMDERLKNLERNR